MPLAIQIFLWRQTRFNTSYFDFELQRVTKSEIRKTKLKVNLISICSPFIRPKFGKLHEATCVVSRHIYIIFLPCRLHRTNRKLQIPLDKRFIFQNSPKQIATFSAFIVETCQNIALSPPSTMLKTIYFETGRSIFMVCPWSTWAWYCFRWHWSCLRHWDPQTLRPLHFETFRPWSIKKLKH